MRPPFQGAGIDVGQADIQSGLRMQPWSSTLPNPGPPKRQRQQRERLLDVLQIASAGDDAVEQRHGVLWMIQTSSKCDLSRNAHVISASF